MSGEIKGLMLLVLLALAGTAAAAPDGTVPRLRDEDLGTLTGAGPYQACLALVARDPDKAFDQALLWRDQGGGAAARHCEALALFALGHEGEAGFRLDALAADNGAGDAALRADILSQAGHAWLMEGEAGRAINSFSTALNLLPEDAPAAVDLQFDRGRAFMLAGDYGRAGEDFTAVLARRPRAVEVLVLRAGAHRAAGALGPGLADAEAALRLRKNDPHALFERGAIRYLQGSTKAAEADLVASLRAKAEGPVADAARTVLERIALGEPAETALPSPDGVANPPLIAPMTAAPPKK